MTSTETYPIHAPRIVSDLFRERLGPKTSSKVRAFAASDENAAVQLIHRGAIPHQILMAENAYSKIPVLDDDLTRELAAAVRSLDDEGFVKEILFPVVVMPCQIVDLNIRRMVGLHVIPSDDSSAALVQSRLAELLGSDVETAVRVAISQVSPKDGDVVFLAFKGDIPERQLKAFRQHLWEHSQREQARTGKTVHYLALCGDFDVHMFRPEDRETVKAALARAMASTPIMFNGRPMESKVDRFDYADALSMYNTVHVEGAREGVLYTVTYKNPDGTGGMVAPDLPPAPVVAGMKITMVLTANA